MIPRLLSYAIRDDKDRMERPNHIIPLKDLFFCEGAAGIYIPVVWRREVAYQG